MILWDVHEVIESITAITRFFAIRQQRNANAWVALVRGLFAEEHVAYRIDDDGVVHPLVDQAFEAARVSVIGALGGETFNAARAHFENAIAALEEDPADTRGAVGDCFDAGNDSLVTFKGGIGVDPISNVVVSATTPPVITATANAVRGISPAGQIWVIADLHADVSVDGHIRVKGRGLLLVAAMALGPPPRSMCSRRCFADLRPAPPPVVPAPSEYRLTSTETSSSTTSCLPRPGIPAPRLYS